MRIFRATLLGVGLTLAIPASANGPNVPGGAAFVSGGFVPAGGKHNPLVDLVNSETLYVLVTRVGTSGSCEFNFTDENGLRHENNIVGNPHSPVVPLHPAMDLFIRAVGSEMGCAWGLWFTP